MMSSNVDIITKKIKNTTYIAREAVREADDSFNVVILTDEVPKRDSNLSRCSNSYFMQKYYSGH